MRKNLVGVTTLAVSLCSVGLLGTSYAGTGTRSAAEPTVPDHSLIQGPIKVSDLALFQDASTLWLTDALLARGARASGKKTKFNETTILHTSAWLHVFSDTLVRHKTWSDKIVGGDPSAVYSLNREEYLALAYVINNRLVAELKSDLVVDENGIRGTISAAELGIGEDELKYEAERTASELGSWLAPNCQ